MYLVLFHSVKAEFLTTATTKSCTKTLDTCDYWPRCAACQHKSVSGELKKGPSASGKPLTVLDNVQPHVTSVIVNEDNAVPGPQLRSLEKSNPSWTFLCSGIASICQPVQQTETDHSTAQEAAEEDIVIR